jgi:uncharacterized protein (DUF1330 family)
MVAISLAIDRPARDVASMAAINPTRQQLEDFAATAPDDHPIVMLNLLRFRARAEYGAGATEGEVSGEAAYARYSRAVMPLLWEVGGQPIWMGKARTALIAPAGESWDEVVLVFYPSRRAFLRMINSDAYHAIVRHRTAALLDSRLIETRAVALPRLLFALARWFTRKKALVRPRVGR